MKSSEDGEFELYDVDYAEERKVTDYEIWRTTTFELKQTQGSLERFKSKLEKRDKYGYPIHNDIRKKKMCLDYIQKKMNPISANISGDDFEGSRNAFYHEMFVKTEDKSQKNLTLTQDEQETKQETDTVESERQEGVGDDS